MSDPIYKIVEINDGGDPECDVDTTIVRCFAAGVETEIKRTVYSGGHNEVRFELGNRRVGDVELICGEPCTAVEWNEVLSEFKATIEKLPG